MVRSSFALHWPANGSPLDHRAASCQRPAVFPSPSCLDRLCFCVGVDGLCAPCFSPLLAVPYDQPPHRLHHTPPRWRGSRLAFFYNATPQRSRHLIGITLIDGQLVGNLLIRHIQPHKIQTQDPHFQRLMMASKDGVGQVIKAFGAVVALIALTGRFRVIKATLDDVFGLTRGTRNAVGPAQLTDRLITLDIVDETLDVDLHGWTPVRDRGMGWRQYTPSSHATTLESNMSACGLPRPRRIPCLRGVGCCRISASCHSRCPRWRSSCRPKNPVARN